jgi:MFS family permease
LFTVGLAQALVVIDGIPVAVALPAIRHDLGLSVTEVQWVVNGYVLALAGVLLLAGRCADIFGRRRVLLIGLSTLTVATLLAGLSPSGWALVSARFAQGLGAAMALPTAMALIPILFPEPAQRDRAYGVAAMVNSLAWVVGALAGGLLTELVGWRFVFLASVPFSALAMALAMRSLPESRDELAGRRVDVGGALLITAALTAIVYGITRVEHVGPASATVLGALTLGVALLCAFVVLEARFTHPLVPLSIFRVRPLWGASLAVGANTVAYGGMILIGTLYLQDVLRYSATVTGLLFLSLAVGPLVGPWLARWLAHTGARLLGMTSLLVCAGSLAVLGWLADLGRSHPALLVGIMLVFGVAQYSAWLAVVGQATAGVDDRLYGIASGVFKTSTHISGALSFATASTVIAWVGGQSPEIAAPYTAAYFAIAALTTLGVVAIATLIPASTPRRHRIPA